MIDDEGLPYCDYYIAQEEYVYSKLGFFSAIELTHLERDLEILRSVMEGR